MCTIPRYTCARWSTGRFASTWAVTVAAYFYTLSGETNPSRLPGGASAGPGGSGLSTFGAVFHTVFDAIRTNLNFLSHITDGNESQNIRLFDCDVVT